jgi:hypothetical protein
VPVPPALDVTDRDELLGAIGQESGATSHVVAAALGHGVGINQRNSTEAGTAARAQARQVFGVISGGRS